MDILSSATPSLDEVYDVMLSLLRLLSIRQLDYDGNPNLVFCTPYSIDFLLRQGYAVNTTEYFGKPGPRTIT